MLKTFLRGLWEITAVGRHEAGRREYGRRAADDGGADRASAEALVNVTAWGGGALECRAHIQWGSRGSGHKGMVRGSHAGEIDWPQ